MSRNEQSALFHMLEQKRFSRQAIIAALAALALAGGLVGSKPSRAATKDGNSSLVVGIWAACPQDVPQTKKMGANLYAGALGGPGCSSDDLAAAVGSSGNVLGGLQAGSDGVYNQMPPSEPNQVGVNGPDEYNGKGSASNLVSPNQLPLNGGTDMLNLSDGCFNGSQDCSGYYPKANNLTTDVYPLQGDACSDYANHGFTSVGTVYNVQKAVAAAAAGQPNGQWTEVGPLVAGKGGPCTDSQGNTYHLTPDIEKTEIFEEFEAGATEALFFTDASVDFQGNGLGDMISFEAAPNIVDAVGDAVQELKQSVWPILQGQDLHITASDNDPIKTAGRSDGNNNFLIASNSESSSNSLSSSMPGLVPGETVTVTNLNTGAQAAAVTADSKGSLDYAFDPYTTYSFSWAPEVAGAKPQAGIKNAPKTELPPAARLTPFEIFVKAIR